MSLGRARTRRTVTDAPTEPLAPGRPVTQEYERIEQEPVPPAPPERPSRAWYDELGWALLGLLLLVAIGFAIWWFAFHNNTSKKTVPAVAGTPVAAAVNVLQDRGFKVHIVNQPHPEQRGTVFREIPRAGSRLAKGSTVQVLASTGPAAVRVPNAVGLTEADGRDRLVGADFKVTESRVFSDQPPGKIVAQNPSAGSKVPKAATVRINVSKGTGVVVVANVVGMTLGEAETQLAKGGLKPVVQLRVPSAQPPGTVVAQNPPGGQAKRGSQVELNVSTGSASGASGATGATGASGPTGPSGTG
jgi:eukaryotic-like serine/threonine-protein kinase